MNDVTQWEESRHEPFSPILLLVSTSHLCITDEIHLTQLIKLQSIRTRFQIPSALNDEVIKRVT